MFNSQTGHNGGLSKPRADALYLHQQSGFVTSGFLGDSSVLSGTIGSGQIGASHLASGLFDELKLSSGEITSGYLGNNSVVSGSIASGQIGQYHIASGVLFNVENTSNNRILTSLASGTNKANAESSLTFDGQTLGITSSTSGSNVITATGVNGELFTVTDALDGIILEVGSISGSPILSVNSSGLISLATTYGAVNANRIFVTPTLSGDVTVQEWKNASGTTMASVNASGIFTGYLASGIVVSGNIASGQIGVFHLA